METKIDSKRIERVKRRCGFLNDVEISAIGSRGGLCLAWNDEVQVTLDSFLKIQ